MASTRPPRFWAQPALALSLVLTVALGAGAGQASAAAPRPNIIYIMADDQGYADLGCFGAEDLNTPRLDRMASEGRKFTNFYVTCGVCSPTRSSFMTGCYPRRVGIPGVLFPHHNTGLGAGEVTIAEILKDAGYATGIVGKWHLGHQNEHLPINHGFDSYFGLPYSNDMHPAGANKRNYGPLPLMRGAKVIETDPDQSLLTQRYTDEAIRFITANKDGPFFLYFPHTMPHYPLAASEKFAGKSKRGLYGDVIEEIDWNAGRLFDAVADLGIDDNTLIIYTSDNGPSGRAAGSAYPLRGRKASTFEGGMREPFIARWPGQIPADTVCPELATIMDMLPTFAGLAGAEPPSDRVIDGKDIWELMSGGEYVKTPHEAFFYHKNVTLAAVRSGKWKLSLGKEQFLYDLEEDIGEFRDVANANPDVVEKLLALAEAHLRDLAENSRPTAGDPFMNVAEAHEKYGTKYYLVQPAGASDTRASNP